MFINDVNKKEEIRNIALQYLRKYGIKYRPKKCSNNNKPTVQVSKYGKKLFKVPLQHLETETVTLKNGQQLLLPKRLNDMCSFILSKARTEGIFRKEGSKSRQNEIKLSLDRGCLLGDEHHVIDVAVVLKSFLRDLPEPLVPFPFHDLFLRCSLIEKKLEALHLACLLLPSEHLNVLSYLMQFFSEVAFYSEYNKMNYNNLAIVIGPNIFPIDEKVVPKSTLFLTKICDITKLMMENSKLIGVIPDYIIDEIGSDCPLNDDKKRKKRRSGMLMGLKKIVTIKNDDTNTNYTTNIVTPDLLLTPSISRSVRKRKSEHGISTKKKKDVLNKLPECALLNTPFTPARTPISANPNGKKLTTPLHGNKDVLTQDTNKEQKKLHWYMRSRSMKNLKDTEDGSKKPAAPRKSMLERRWSAVSQAATFRKKSRNSCIGITNSKVNGEKHEETQNKLAEEADYVRVSKMEYEEIKNRVSAIERRISLELECVGNKNGENVDVSDKGATTKDNCENAANNIKDVQMAYEQTLEQATSLSPTTDHLAKRLSRDLRIRRSAEQKVIRSPSARKIGSLRRRSREVEKKLTRNQSWHMGETSDNRSAVENNKKKTVEAKTDNKNIEKNTLNVQRSTSLRTCSSTSSGYGRSLDDNSSHISCNKSGSSSEHWVSADGFFQSLRTPHNSCGSDRASIAKLRSQNAGMVMAKARLFDKLKDESNDLSNGTNKRQSVATNAKKSILIRAPEATSHKIGAVRNPATDCSSRTSYRMRSVRSDEKRMKKNTSPRRRNVATMSYRQRLQAARQYVRSNNTSNNKEHSATSESSSSSSRVNDSLATPLRELRILAGRGSPINRCTPITSRNMPQMKKSLTAKSPKRLCRTPGAADRKTPMKAVSSVMIGDDEV